MIHTACITLYTACVTIHAASQFTLHASCFTLDASCVVPQSECVRFTPPPYSHCGGSLLHSFDDITHHVPAHSWGHKPRTPATPCICAPHPESASAPLNLRAPLDLRSLDLRPAPPPESAWLRLAPQAPALPVWAPLCGECSRGAPTAVDLHNSAPGAFIQRRERLQAGLRCLRHALRLLTSQE